MTEGRITIDGVESGRSPVPAARSIVAQTRLFPRPSANIAFGRGPTDAEVERAARLAQAHDFIAALPDGYDTVIGERGITLSGGQRQRLAIARALIMEPRILILDDATASVDATTEAKIRLGLREAMKGRTTIIIAHRLSTISLADELVVLDNGRIVGRGTDEELLRTNAVYRDIHEHGLLEAEFAHRVEATAEASTG
jgi:ATP-binding cassette subfamily B protein